jgi:hypothetical protein
MTEKKRDSWSRGESSLAAVMNMSLAATGLVKEINKEGAKSIAKKKIGWCLMCDDVSEQREAIFS